jgi:hypothetical protein
MNQEIELTGEALLLGLSLPPWLHQTQNHPFASIEKAALGIAQVSSRMGRGSTTNC